MLIFSKQFLLTVEVAPMARAMPAIP